MLTWSDLDQTMSSSSVICMTWGRGAQFRSTLEPLVVITEMSFADDGKLSFLGDGVCLLLSVYGCALFIWLEITWMPIVS